MGLRLLGLLKGKELVVAVSIFLGAYLAVYVYNSKMAQESKPESMIGEPGRIAKMWDVKEAERSAKEYADLRSNANKELLVTNHEEILRRLDVVAGDLNRLTETTRILGERVFQLQGKIPQGRHADLPPSDLEKAGLATTPALPYATSL
jgi:hypothetical protein